MPGISMASIPEYRLPAQMEKAAQVVKFPFGEKFLELELNQPADVLLPELVEAAPDKLSAIRKAVVQPIGSTNGW